jgi:DNA-binding NtrC family response regulator
MRADRHVLLVDDDPDLVEVMAFALRARGHRVTVSHSTARARHLVELDPPDLVLSNNPVFLRELAAAHPDITRVLMWGSFLDEWAGLLASGAVRSVLRKPFELDQLLSCLTDAAAG